MVSRLWCRAFRCRYKNEPYSPLVFCLIWRRRISGISKYLTLISSAISKIRTVALHCSKLHRAQEFEDYGIQRECCWTRGLEVQRMQNAADGLPTNFVTDHVDPFEKDIANWARLARTNIRTNRCLSGSHVITFPRADVIAADNASFPTITLTLVEPIQSDQVRCRITDSKMLHTYSENGVTTFQ